MQNAPDRWAASFRDGLVLLGRAIARLPFGVDEPVLVGTSALEFYSGGAWSYGELELATDAPRALNAALMAEGFRWTDRPRHTARGLWHPELQIAAEMTPQASPEGIVDPMAAVTVELEATPSPGSGMTRLRVTGIEQLIVERAGAWVAHRGSRREFAQQVQLLAELAQAGAGGVLRVDYLRRRLACATAGEVHLDLSHPPGQPDHDGVRSITETAMLAAIQVWRVRRGFPPLTAQRPTSSVHRRSAAQKTSSQDESGKRARGRAAPNVIAFDPVRQPARV